MDHRVHSAQNSLSKIIVPLKPHMNVTLTELYKYCYENNNLLTLKGKVEWHTLSEFDS